MDSVPGAIGLSEDDVKVNRPLELLPVDQLWFAESSIWTSACAIGWPVAMSLTTPLTWVTDDCAVGDAATALIVNVSEVSVPWVPSTVACMMILP
jgi:hypothetical protein